MNGMQRLAQAERDCLDLHKALADAIKRLTVIHYGLMLSIDNNSIPQSVHEALTTSDLWDVLGSARRGRHPRNLNNSSVLY